APGSPVGALVPQPPVRVDGATERLDDLLGPGWAVLTCGAADAPTLPDAPEPRVLRVGSGPGELHSPELLGWLRGRAVLVRPDRIVAAVGPRSSIVASPPTASPGEP
ncbi:MAG: Monooxygenase, FAD-binding, partial [Modestobacter sp.]|nr:Monooxygenase, FAD-binding [Modestobacter sp.]